MTKKEAVSIIIRCAALYQKNLCSRQLAFIYLDKGGHSRFVEVHFRSNNFLHFTGIDTRTEIKANAFYRSALDKRLKESDILFKDNGTTVLKLQVLPEIMNIPFSARMIGDYMGPRLALYTEKAAGTTTACLGLVRGSSTYVPNTVLKGDIRNFVQKPAGKIIAILRKQAENKLYNELTYKGKNYTLTPESFPLELAEKTDISSVIH